MYYMWSYNIVWPLSLRKACSWLGSWVSNSLPAVVGSCWPEMPPGHLAHDRAMGKALCSGKTVRSRVPVRENYRLWLVTLTSRVKCPHWKLKRDCLDRPLRPSLFCLGWSLCLLCFSCILHPLIQTGVCGGGVLCLLRNITKPLREGEICIMWNWESIK